MKYLLIISITICIVFWVTAIWKDIYYYIEYIIFDKEYLLFSIKWFAGTTIGIFLFYKHIWNFILSSILPDRKKFDVYSNI
jgi:hypothetical protein